MRWVQFGLLGMGMAMVWLAGCHSSERFEPPKLQETYILPPSDDPRFNQPPSYPRDAQNEFGMKKEKKDEKAGGPTFGGPSGMRSGPGTNY